MFYEDLKKGKVGENIFLHYYKDKFKNIDDVTNDTAYQKIDVDFLVDEFKVDVKFNYKDNGYLPFEEYTNNSPYVQGWLEKSKADIICCLSFKTAIFIKLPLFIEWWTTNKNNYELLDNERSYGSNGNSWRGAFRWVKVADIPSNVYTIRNFV